MRHQCLLQIRDEVVVLADNRHRSERRDKEEKKECHCVGQPWNKVINGIRSVLIYHHLFFHIGTVKERNSTDKE